MCRIIGDQYNRISARNGQAACVLIVLIAPINARVYHATQFVQYVQFHISGAAQFYLQVKNALWGRIGRQDDGLKLSSQKG